jgi:putative hydrolase of the HAD superfamily
MILFDYGHTLLYEAKYDEVRGMEAILAHAVSNPNNLTAEEIAVVSNEIFIDTGKRARHNGVEIHNHNTSRLLYEYLEIDIPLSPDEHDTIFWDHAAPGEPMPNVKEMLNYINEKGIRSGVISNIAFSGNTLAERINRLLPNNQFEFFIASSDYVYRKPNRFLFEIALKKAHLESEEVWFCGDNVEADIIGAASVGILPVWYQSELVCPYRKDIVDNEPELEHLHIRDWNELIGILKTL